MRIIFLSSLLVTLLLASLSISPVYADCNAATMGDAGSFLKDCGSFTIGVSPDQGGDGVTSVKSTVIRVAKNIIRFGALFAIGAIVFSGVQYTSSFGDDEKIKKAKMTGVYAVIGLIILLVSFPLVDIIVGFIYGLV